MEHGAKPDMPMLTQLRPLGVRLLVDTQAWRVGDERTWEVDKYVRLGHRPVSPISMDGVDAFADFVGADIAWQISLGADALLLPGLMPLKDDDAGIRSLGLAAEVALRSDAAAGVPTVGFLGIHSQSLTDVPSFTADPIIRLLSGLYVQVSPVNPMTDSVSKLVYVAQAMLRFEEVGVPVVAGHLGALGGMLRSVGVTAADAGLGRGETFDAKRTLRRSSSKDSESTGGPSGARYVSQLLRSVSRHQWDSMMAGRSTTRRGARQPLLVVGELVAVPEEHRLEVRRVLRSMLVQGAQAIGLGERDASLTVESGLRAGEERPRGPRSVSDDRGLEALRDGVGRRGDEGAATACATWARGADSPCAARVSGPSARRNRSPASFPSVSLPT